MRCRVNAALENECGYEVKPAEKKKRVMVVGGGPAGDGGGKGSGAEGARSTTL